MDARPEHAVDDPLAVVGLGTAVVGPDDQPCDPMPYLKVKKLRKYMGVQDDLAVVAAARALESAGLAGSSLGERTGLYLVVGYIPFEQGDIEPLLAGSLDASGRFSMEAFSTVGFRSVNGLLTFRCLPNMPAFHISANFDLQGPYFVTYPGPGQFYLALDEACRALREGRIDMALVGGVAHQRNFLVTSHFQRLTPPLAGSVLMDAASCLVLKRQRDTNDGIRARLCDYTIRYRAVDPFEESEFEVPAEELGPAGLPVLLSQAKCGSFTHRLRSRDGIEATSRWELP